MAKVNIQSCSYRRQSPVGGIKQRFGSDIILWSEPFPFHNTPKGLHNVQMRRVWRNVEEKKSPFFPYWTHSLYFLITMYTCIVKHNKCLSVELERESVEEINNFLCIDRIAGAESFKAVIPVNHAKDVEPFGFFDRNVNALLRQTATHKGHSLPCRYEIRHHRRGRWSLFQKVFQVLAASRSYTHRAAARAYP